MTLQFCRATRGTQFLRTLLRTPLQPQVVPPDEGIRVCPLFTELRPILQTLYDLATVEGARPDPATFVIDKPGYRAAANTERGWANANLGTQFLKILGRAQVKPWKRIFHSMRASRQTELEARFPLHVVCRWLGNTEEVARESYLLTSEEHFKAATRAKNDDVENDAQEAQNDAESSAVHVCVRQRRIANCQGKR